MGKRTRYSAEFKAKAALEVLNFDAASHNPRIVPLTGFPCRQKSTTSLRQLRSNGKVERVLAP